MRLVVFSAAVLLAVQASAQDFSEWYLGGGIGTGLDGDTFEGGKRPPYGAAFAGYNHITEGGFLFGIEAGISLGHKPIERLLHDASWGSNDFPWENWWTSYSPSLPEGATLDGPQIGHERLGTFTLHSHFRQTEEITEQFSPTISARLGKVIGNSLIYAKAGVGATLVSFKGIYDDSGSKYCTNFLVQYDYSAASFGGYETRRTALGCVEEHNGSTVTLEANKWFPVGTIGVGLEHNVGQMFARTEAEARYIDTRGGTITQFQTGVFLGFRF